MTDEIATESSFTFGPLYDLLRNRFPEHRTDTGRFDVPRFADDLKMSNEGVYKWLRANKITPDGAKNVVAMSKGRATLEDFHKFVFA
jgi:hypothetical protein